MLCKECWEKAGKPYYKYYKVYKRHAIVSLHCRGLNSRCNPYSTVLTNIIQQLVED